MLCFPGKDVRYPVVDLGQIIRQHLRYSFFISIEVTFECDGVLNSVTMEGAEKTCYLNDGGRLRRVVVMWKELGS